MPLKNPDFSPFLQRMADDKPDAVFVFVPSGFGAIFMKQFVERGLDKSGIKLIGTGDVTDDDLLADIGDAALGAVTTHHYSADHDLPENKAFVAAFEKANNGMRPNFMAVAAYDGMDLVYKALEKTKGDASGDALIGGDEGHELDEPARARLDRPRNPRDRAEHLRPQGREEGRRALQRRVRDDPDGEGPVQGEQELTRRRRRQTRGHAVSVGPVAFGARPRTVVVGPDPADDRPVASTGKQEKAGAELYIAQHGATVAGKKINLVIKDDTGAADVTKRLAQELVANDHAAVLMGFGLTPLALAAAPIATEAKVPEIVTAAATAMITEKSPYIVRTSFTLPQASAPMADWALKNGIKKVVTIVTDYGPGIDAEKWFGSTFKKGGGRSPSRSACR